MTTPTLRRYGQGSAVQNRNQVKLSWILAVMGLFFGVWWTLFVDELLHSTITSLAIGSRSLDSLQEITVCGAGLFIAAYAYWTVRWLWTLQSHDPRYARATRVASEMIWPTIASGTLVLLIALASWAFDLDRGNAVYGSTLVFSWLVVPRAVMFL